MGWPSPSAVRSLRRSWPTTTGAAPSSPTQPAPGTPASSTTGAASRGPWPARAAGARLITTTSSPPPADR
jgi:hypothetical protein